MDSRELTRLLFGESRVLIGMLHLGPLPGSPRHVAGSFDATIERAVAEARLYREAGFHGLLLENMHDRPYLKGTVGPETVAAMVAAGREVRRSVALPLGVQVLAGANREALAVAAACGAAFVRVEGFVFAHVADEGLIEAAAGPLLRYRRGLGAEQIRIFADIKKKHASHALTADLDIAATAEAAEFSLADGLIVTGSATGRPAAPSEVAQVADAVRVPVFIGSGVAPDNLAQYPQADGFIVGSWVKEEGYWAHPVDPQRVRQIVAARNAAGSAGAASA
jgi:membrane complex biogenesis BtpA family protein